MAGNVLESISRRLQEYSGNAYGMQLKILEKASKGEFESAFAMQAKVFTDQATMVHDLITDFCDLYVMFQLHTEAQVKTNKKNDLRMSSLESQMRLFMNQQPQSVANLAISSSVDLKPEGTSSNSPPRSPRSLPDVTNHNSAEDFEQNLEDYACEKERQDVNDVRRKLQKKIKGLVEQNASEGHDDKRPSTTDKLSKLRKFQVISAEEELNVGDHLSAAVSSCAAPIARRAVTVDGTRSMRGRKRTAPKALADFYLDGDDIDYSLQRRQSTPDSARRKVFESPNSTDDFLVGCSPKRSRVARKAISKIDDVSAINFVNGVSPRTSSENSDSESEKRRRSPRAPRTRSSARACEKGRARDSVKRRGGGIASGDGGDGVHENGGDFSEEIFSCSEVDQCESLRRGWKARCSVASQLLQLNYSDEDDYDSVSSGDEDSSCVLKEHSYSQFHCGHRHAISVVPRDTDAVTDATSMSDAASASLPSKRSKDSRQRTKASSPSPQASDEVETVGVSRLRSRTLRTSSPSLDTVDTSVVWHVDSEELSVDGNAAAAAETVEIGMLSTKVSSSLLDISIASESSHVQQMRTLRIKLLDVYNVYKLWETMRDFVSNKKAVLLKIPVNKMVRKKVLTLCNVCNLNYKVGAKLIIVVKHNSTPPISVGHLEQTIRALEMPCSTQQFLY